MLEILDTQHLVGLAELDLITDRTRRSDCSDFVERELALGKDVQELAPDIACRPDDRDPITHVNLSRLRTAPIASDCEWRYGSSSCAHKGGHSCGETRYSHRGSLSSSSRQWSRSLCSSPSRRSTAVRARSMQIGQRHDCRSSLATSGRTPLTAKPTTRFAHG